MDLCINLERVDDEKDVVTKSRFDPLLSIEFAMDFICDGTVLLRTIK